MADSQRAAEVCITDIFLGEASREPRQYAADGTQLLPATSALHGDAPICRRYLHQISLGQLPNGLFMDCCPGKGDPKIIVAESGFLHVKVLWDHYVRFGDHKLLEEHWETIQHHLAFWGGLANARGLLSVEDTGRVVQTGFYWPWFDWAHLDRRGEMLILNAMYLLNLRVGAQICLIVGEDDKTAEYEHRINQVSGVLTTEFWDDARGLFVDTLANGEMSPMSSEHSQGIMLYLGLATKEQAARLVQVWERSPHTLAEADIAFLYYILEGLVKYGYAEFALRLFRRLNRHLDRGSETFGEVWSLRGESSSPTGVRCLAEVWP